MKRGQFGSERGQELVEFALTISILLLIILGILDIGRLVYSWSALEYATRAGARFGVVQPDDTAAIQDAVREAAVGVPLVADDITVELLDLDASLSGFDALRVSVNYQFTSVSPVIGALLGPDRRVTAQTTMRLER